MRSTRWGLAAALSLLGCVRSEAPANRPPTPSARTEVVNVARIVPQLEFDLASYLRTTKGGRFALFGNAVVDLKAGRLARSDGSAFLDMEAPEDSAVRLSNEQVGIEVVNLLDGGTVPFAGVALSHASLQGGTALAHDDGVDIVNLGRSRLIARLAAPGTPLSLVEARDKWSLLSRDDGANPTGKPASSSGTDAKGPSLVVRSFSAPSGRLDQVWQVDLGEGSLAPWTASEIHSDFFLVRGADDKIGLGVVTRCASCRPRELFLRTRSITAEGDARRWTAAPLDAHIPSSGLPKEGPHTQPLPALPVPEDVKRVVTSMHRSVFGVAQDVAPDAGHLITGTTARLCVWSLPAARREYCIPRKAQTAIFLDATRAWLIAGTMGGPQTLSVWVLATRNVVDRHFERGEILPAPLGPRFLVLTQAGAIWSTAHWTWGRDQPDWTHQGCMAKPWWTMSGNVACHDDESREHQVTLDAASGRPTAASAAAKFDDRAPFPCGYERSVDPAIVLSKHDRPIVTFYDIGPSSWAIALPSGEFTGTPDVSRYLAFYSPSGSPLRDVEVRGLENPIAVERALRDVMSDVRKCSAPVSSHP